VIDSGAELADLEAGEAQGVGERADALDGGVVLEVAGRAGHVARHCEGRAAR
jgi:hypothetical protein